MKIQKCLLLSAAGFAIVASPIAVNADTASDMSRNSSRASRGELPAYLQCVPFARQVSGVQIYGDAHSWWGQAESKYQRGNTPKLGAVMAFKPHRNMRVGHVATVSKIIDDRTVLLTHANWSPINGRRGQVEYNVKAIDVSARGNWTKVRVWFDPIKAIGRTDWPVHGFIYSPQSPRELAVSFAQAGAQKSERQQPASGSANRAQRAAAYAQSRRAAANPTRAPARTSARKDSADASSGARVSWANASQYVNSEVPAGQIRAGGSAPAITAAPSRKFSQAFSGVGQSSAQNSAQNSAQSSAQYSAQGGRQASGQRESATNARGNNAFSAEFAQGFAGNRAQNTPAERRASPNVNAAAGGSSTYAAPRRPAVTAGSNQPGWAVQYAPPARNATPAPRTAAPSSAENQANGNDVIGRAIARYDQR